MLKELRYYPEIVDLWVLPSRWLGTPFKLALIVGVHLLLFKTMSYIGPKDPYTFHQEQVMLDQQQFVHSYDFSRLGKTFLPWQFHRLEEIDGPTLEKLLLQSVPKSLQPRLENYIKQTLTLSEYYQMDPLWVLSIMWTESHFNQKATSSVNAKGLMQIMPGTAHHVMSLMNRPVSPQIAYRLVTDWQKNLEMGTFYLRMLFINFNFDFKYATIAYNMGPNGVLRRLRRGISVGRNHLYYKKVRRHYRRLLGTVQAHLVANPAPYTKTLVVKKRWSSLQESPILADIFKKWPVLAASNISSQRLEL